MEHKIYSKEGKEVGKIKLPEEIFNLAWNGDLVHQVVTGMLSNARENNAHTKDRSEKRGGGKKPWRQKGTGRARHGSRRSPIWTGGGVTFGPRNERNYDKKINKKMKNKALFTVLSQKVRDGELIFIDDINFKEPKTKEAKAIIDNVSKGSKIEDFANKKRNKAYIATDEFDTDAQKSFSNFGNIKLDEVRNLNPVDILRYKYIVIENPTESIKKLESRNK